MNKTTNRYLTALLLLSFWGYAQTPVNRKVYAQIPQEYQSHPELGKQGHTATLHQVDYELIQQRTKYSRTFLNTNTTKTTVQSSAPLHYKGADGQWYSIDYSFTEKGNKLVYPAQDPFFEMDSQNTSLLIAGKSISIRKQSDFTFISNGSAVKKMTATNRPAVVKDKNKLEFQNILENVSRTVAIYNGALKYDYSINDAGFLPETFDYLLIEDIVDLPIGFSLKQENDRNRLIMVNQKGEEVLVFQQPVITDSKVLLRNTRPKPYLAKYQLVRVDANTYKIQIRIDNTWLKSADRVYPINIDPVVTIANEEAVNSCYSPNYEQSILQVAIPEGETILTSNISYDFVAVAGSGAWMADQLSFVAGPSGVTPIMYGSGNAEGTQTYNITDSPIANTLSPGTIDFIFNFSRGWGGDGCDAAFNFVNRREVSVTYGTIEFGDGPLLINEYSASNRNFNDGFGRNEDWVELYNASPDTYFDLSGYYLSNNINNPTKWQIQDGVIPPNSRVLVYCSNRDISSGTVLHASFDLTQTDPDEVVLSSPNGTVLESHSLFRTQTNHSYGRTTDGASSWSVFSTPTPGQQNTNGFSGYTTKPMLSVAAGNYPGPINVSLSSTGQNEEIRYTTNGTTPTAASTLYSGPIAVNQSTVIRARAFSTDPGRLPGFIETNSYFIGESSSLPLVSISGDVNLLQLLGGTTIEPTGYFEYFESNGTFVDETMGDFDRHGNDSWAYDQRGIDFIARDDHGYKRRLEHPFFDTTDRTNFRRLILKAAGSDNYPHQDGGAHMRDVFAQKLSEVSGLELDERKSVFVSLFVNGQYWGIYDLREKVDDNQYTDYYYGQDYLYRDSDQYIQYIKTWGNTYAEFGNQPAISAWDELLAFVQNNDMSDEANYNYVESQLNIDSLVDYFVLNSYLVNKDWLNWNTSWWRGTDPSGGALKWRYALWDMDGILGHYTNYTGIPDISADADPCNVENLEVGEGHAQTIGKLVEESPIVRQKYITRYADLLNTHLSCDQVTALFDSIVATIAPEMPRQIARWGGSLEEWEANVADARNFLLARCSQTISTGLVDCYQVTGPFEATLQIEPAGTGKIRMNSEWLTAYPFSAQIFGNIETLLKAEANEGYQFSHWTVDGATINPDDENPDIVLEILQATSVTAHFTEILNPAQALYYWHFNNFDPASSVTTIPADFGLIEDADATMTYTGTGPSNIDDYSTGSIINTHFNQPSGKCARVRNPSEGRTLLFNLPTTGYQDIKFSYAMQRTNSGQLSNIISYSADGTNFTQLPNVYNVATEFGLIEADLTGIPAANNNPNFKIRIAFQGNTTGDSGNNRIDNITLKGSLALSVPTLDAGTYQVYPNPFTNNIQVFTSEPMTELSVYDMVGKKVSQKQPVGTNAETIDLSALNAGVYLLKIKTSRGILTHKLVKQ